jgi:lysozyme
MSRVTQGGAVAALLVAAIAAFEGLRLIAYPDPATGGAPWTVCYGHTEAVKPNDRYTPAQCKAQLKQDLELYASGIEACVSAPLPDKRYVALVSFAYNVGLRAACESSVVRHINAGRTRQGCDAFLLWDKAAGIRFPGLTKRRQKEREFCLAELPL